MARLIPKVSVNSIKVKPERDVAQALVEQLPSNVLVYHSYPWLNAERIYKFKKDTLKEGEADFVIVIPDIGFLVLEVKGGTIEFDNENQLWFRRLPSGKTREIKDPFDQARTNTHVLKEKFLKEIGTFDSAPPCTFGYAVIFPDCEYNGTPPPGSDNAIILTCNDLSHLGQRIPSILRKWCRLKTPIPMTDNGLAALKRALNSTFNLVPVLSRQIEEDEESLIRLTEEQARILDVLKNQDRCCIEGVAGSGKTLLAFEQANRFARNELKTLFVCYNKTLAQWLKSTIPDTSKNFLDIYTFHGLCLHICKLAGVVYDPSSANNETFYRNQAPSLLLDAIDKLGAQYDAVVVDEGQDFYSEWWVPLELLCHKEDAAPFYLFYDPAQNLFVEDPGLPNIGKPFTLPTNCRNTKKITSVCASITNTTIKTHDLAPDGREVRFHVCKDADQQLSKCQNILKVLKKNGVNPNQIVIQSPFRRDGSKSSFNGIGQIGGYPIVINFNEWRKSEGILFSTIRSFKGLEADIVLLVDLPDFNSSKVFTVNDYYVGASRAKHVLEILAKDQIVVSGYSGA
jgi:hypothetical protein